MSSEFFNEVGSWSIEALDEDNERYFYHFSDVSRIQSGQKNYVIGRKGTGKTAIAEYIKSRPGAGGQARLLSFKSFPFNQVYELEDNNFTTPNQYISLWEYLIYSSVCNMMITSPKVDALRRKELDSLFAFDIENALAKSIKKISDRGFSLSILGSGGSVTAAQANTKDAFSLESRNDILRSYINQHICDNPYYVIFDALDEDYKGVLQPDRRQTYFDLLISLLKAVQNVRRSFPNAKVIPIVFLRNDIFDLCRDPDKNKWIDRSIVLDWNSDTLKKLIAFRLARAEDKSAEPKAFADIWYKYFERDVRTNRKVRKTEDSFSYLLRFTYMRPRDAISYIRECAKIAYNRSLPFVTGAMIKEANAAHSAYMRREIVDETYSVIDNISEILDVLSEQRRSIFSQDDFKSLYERNFQNNIQEGEYSLSYDEISKLLYHFNVIGNVQSGSNRQIYSYASNSKKLNPRENVCIHIGLLKALDIV